jgi:hypothetical protein
MHDGQALSIPQSLGPRRRRNQRSVCYRTISSPERCTSAAVTASIARFCSVLTSGRDHSRDALRVEPRPALIEIGDQRRSPISSPVSGSTR